MDVNLATSIIAEAKSHGVFKMEMPEEDERRIVEAEKLVRQAKAAREGGVKSPVVGAIIALAEGAENAAPSAEDTPPANDEPTADEAKENPNVDEQENAGEAEEPAQIPELEDDIQLPPVEASTSEDAPAPTTDEGGEDDSSRPRGGHNPEGKKGYEWECALCDYACGSQRGLKGHANKKHDGDWLAVSGQQTQIPDAIEQDRTVSQEVDADEGQSVQPKPASEALKAVEEAVSGRTTADSSGGDSVTHDPAPAPQEAGAPPAPGKSTVHEAIEYVNRERALSKVRSMNLPIPKDFEGKPPERPQDMSTLSEAELRKLHSEFNACSAYARYQLALEEVAADDCKKVIRKRKGAAADAVGRLDKSGKPKTQAVLDAEALKHDPEIGKWMDRQEEHLSTARILRAMLEGYDLDCSRISREMSMRVTEEGHSTPPRGA